MSMIDPIKRWIVGIGLKKAVKAAAKLIVSYAIAHKISFNIIIGGIAIDTTNIEIMTVAINSGVVFACNWLKTRWPDKFSWL